MINLSMWWKIYFWVLAILTGVSLFGVFLSTLGFIDWVSIVLGVTQVVGTYFYVFNKKVESSLWKVVFWANAIFWVVNFVYEFMLPESTKSQFSILRSGIEDVSKGLMIFSFIFILPAMYALYKLSNKSSKKK